MSDNRSATALLATARKQPDDLRVEVILAELLECGYIFDDFLVQPLGLFARHYRRDLGEVYEEQFQQGRRRTTRLVLEIHREGLYDALPQQLFHHPGTAAGDATSGVGAIVDGIRQQRRQERASRQFFLPLEQEFFRFRVRIEQLERQYLASLSPRWYNEVMSRFWGLGEAVLPAEPLSALLYLLPLAHQVIGDLRRTQLCFESVLGHAIQLRVISPLRYALSAGFPLRTQDPTLGNMLLGCDLVLSGEYREVLPALEITLHGLTVTDLEAYLNGDWPAKALALLCEYFVALETDVVVHYAVQQAQPIFLLGEGQAAAILGYTTAGI